MKDEAAEKAEIFPAKALGSVFRKMVFKKNGDLTWFGYMLAFTALAFAAATCSALGGCVNVYTRSPFTQPKIEDTYQCTKEAAAFSIVVMFPQCMSPSGSPGFMPENLITIPFGCIGLCDTICEACLDTVFYPADAYLSRTRKATNRAIRE